MRGRGLAVVVVALLATCSLAEAQDGKTSSKGYIEMPVAEDGAWALTHPPGSGRSWGRPVFIRYLALVAREWQRRHPELPKLRLGDLSKPDGSNFPPHKTHKDGLTADIFTTPRNICHVNYPNQQHTLELAQLMVDYGAKQILYNGELVVTNVPIAKKWPKHDDHFHIVIDPSKVPDDGAPVVFANTPADGGWVGIDDVKEDLTGLKLSWRVLGKTKLKSCRVLVDDLARGGEPLHDSGPVKPRGSSYTLPLALRGGTKYRWKVELEASDGTTAATGWQTITTDFTRPQVAATGPAEGAETDIPPKLTWTFKKAGARQEQYRIELDGDSNHRKIKKTLGPFKGRTPSHTIDVKHLKRVKRYFWRVVASDNHGNEGASEWRTFKTGRKFGKTKTTKERGKTKKPKRVKGGRYAKTVASRLNVREAGRVGATVLTTLRYGTEVRILEEANNWAKVEVTVDGKEIVGWCYMTYLKE